MVAKKIIQLSEAVKVFKRDDETIQLTKEFVNRRWCHFWEEQTVLCQVFTSQIASGAIGRCQCGFGTYARETCLKNLKMQGCAKLTLKQVSVFLKAKVSYTTCKVHRLKKPFMYNLLVYHRRVHFLTYIIILISKTCHL